MLKIIHLNCLVKSQQAGNYYILTKLILKRHIDLSDKVNSVKLVDIKSHPYVNYFYQLYKNQVSNQVFLLCLTIQTYSPRNSKLDPSRSIDKFA